MQFQTEEEPVIWWKVKPFFPPFSHAPNILTTKIYCIIFSNVIICNMYLLMLSFQFC